MFYKTMFFNKKNKSDSFLSNWKWWLTFKYQAGNSFISSLSLWGYYKFWWLGLNLMSLTFNLFANCMRIFLVMYDFIAFNNMAFLFFYWLFFMFSYAFKMVMFMQNVSLDVMIVKFNNLIDKNTDYISIKLILLLKAFKFNSSFFNWYIVRVIWYYLWYYASWKFIMVYLLIWQTSKLLIKVNAWCLLFNSMIKGVNFFNYSSAQNVYLYTLADCHYFTFKKFWLSLFVFKNLLKLLRWKLMHFNFWLIWSYMSYILWFISGFTLRDVEMGPWLFVEDFEYLDPESSTYRKRAWYFLWKWLLTNKSKLYATDDLRLGFHYYNWKFMLLLRQSWLQLVWFSSCNCCFFKVYDQLLGVWNFFNIHQAHTSGLLMNSLKLLQSKLYILKWELSKMSKYEFKFYGAGLFEEDKSTFHWVILNPLTKIVTDLDQKYKSISIFLINLMNLNIKFWFAATKFHYKFLAGKFMINSLAVCSPIIYKFIMKFYLNYSSSDVLIKILSPSKGHLLDSLSKTMYYLRFCILYKWGMFLEQNVMSYHFFYLGFYTSLKFIWFEDWTKMVEHFFDMFGFVLISDVLIMFTYLSQVIKTFILFSWLDVIVQFVFIWLRFLRVWCCWGLVLFLTNCLVLFDLMKFSSNWVNGGFVYFKICEFNLFYNLLFIINTSSSSLIKIFSKIFYMCYLLKLMYFNYQSSYKSKSLNEFYSLLYKNWFFKLFSSKYALKLHNDWHNILTTMLITLSPFILLFGFNVLLFVFDMFICYVISLLFILWRFGGKRLYNLILIKCLCWLSANIIKKFINFLFSFYVKGGSYSVILLYLLKKMFQYWIFLVGSIYSHQMLITMSFMNFYNLLQGSLPVKKCKK